MSPLFEKLSLKHQTELFVLNAPETFEHELNAVRTLRIRRALGKTSNVTFMLAFVTRKSEIDALAKQLAKVAPGDPVIWLAYPKKTSPRLESEIDRDHGWDAMRAAGFEGMRMVSIDNDWSAKRVRRVEFIKQQA